MRTLILSLALGALAACSSKPPPSAVAPLPPATTAPPSSAKTKQALVSEQHRLADLFRGTPVVFSMQGDGSLRVEVPLHFCFDPGQSAVKPPLAAVLDRLARSQQRENTRLVVTAPTDPQTTGLSLATERATGMRNHMVALGVAASRFTISAVARGPVRIVVADAASAIPAP